jgi:hypothetical protein
MAIPKTAALPLGDTPAAQESEQISICLHSLKTINATRIQHFKSTGSKTKEVVGIF